MAILNSFVMAISYFYFITIFGLLVKLNFAWGMKSEVSAMKDDLMSLENKMTDIKDTLDKHEQSPTSIPTDLELAAETTSKQVPKDNTWGNTIKSVASLPYYGTKAVLSVPNKIYKTLIGSNAKKLDSLNLEKIAEKIKDAGNPINNKKELIDLSNKVDMALKYEKKKQRIKLAGLATLAVTAPTASLLVNYNNNKTPENIKPVDLYTPSKDTQHNPYQYTDILAQDPSKDINFIDLYGTDKDDQYDIYKYTDILEKDHFNTNRVKYTAIILTITIALGIVIVIALFYLYPSFSPYQHLPSISY